MDERAPSKTERRAALIELRRLLARTEPSLAVDASPTGPGLDEIGKAFDFFRARYHENEEGEAPRTAATHAQRTTLRALAATITEINESISSRDSEQLQIALNDAK